MRTDKCGRILSVRSCPRSDRPDRRQQMYRGRNALKLLSIYVEKMSPKHTEKSSSHSFVRSFCFCSCLQNTKNAMPCTCIGQQSKPIQSQCWRAWDERTFALQHTVFHSPKTERMVVYENIFSEEKCTQCARQLYFVTVR